MSPDSSDAIGWYDDHAEAVVERHESIAPEMVNAWLENVLPSQPALVYVRVVRELALDLLKRDRLFCVWTGKKLKEDFLDI